MHLITHFEEIKKNIDVRANLSNLRKLVKEERNKQEFNKLVKDRTIIYNCLKNEDPKTRKNAALLIGDMQWQDGASCIFDTYKSETTLFVKCSYLVALEKIDASGFLPELKERLAQLRAFDENDDNFKHYQDEMREINKIIIKYEGISKHTFSITKVDGQVPELDLLLITNRLHREVVRRQIKNGSAKLHPLGVLVRTRDITSVYKLRTYRELLFPIVTNGMISSEPKEAAKSIWESNLKDLLILLHKEDTPFYYRVQCKNAMALDERSAFTKKFTSELDRLSEGFLINSASDYEIEIRLIANKEGKYLVALKLFTLKDKRFLYRKNAISASIHPSVAALIVELSKPYLKEDAQVMDPFCGVGTMMIERDNLCHAREMYGTDIFGDAIEMARENTLLAGKRINYIHRDFFDFRHDYKFDEIITNMPIRGKKSKDEMDNLYASFFDKAQEILSDDGIIIMYTNEMAFVKKQLRLHKNIQLLQETLMQKKSEFYLIILGYKR